MAVLPGHAEFSGRDRSRGEPARVGTDNRVNSRRVILMRLIDYSSVYATKNQKIFIVDQMKGEV